MAHESSICHRCPGSLDARSLRRTASGYNFPPVASPVASADSEAAAGPSASSAITTTIPSTTTMVPLKDAVATMDPQGVWQNFYD